jgi:transcriptional regulator with XRE-family HTH domain
MPTIAIRLRQERERLGITQSDLGKKSSLTRTTMGDYESGRRIPDANYLVALDVCGFDVLYILTGRRETPAIPAQVTTGHSPYREAVRAILREDITQAITAAMMDDLLKHGPLAHAIRQLIHS